MKLSVIVPTYNRCKILAQSLSALFAQQLDASWEIIVVDDGSTDATAQVVAKAKSDSPVPLAYYYQANQGPAAARNRGIRSANAPLILMIGDDIISTPHLLTHHVRAHTQWPVLGDVILGRVVWDPSLSVTPFMRWWIENRFRFDVLLTGKVEPDFTFFYTCNISVKRDFLLEHGMFDEGFRKAAYEDTELAYRLRGAGLTLHFVPEALAYHKHPTDLALACRRMRVIGRWSVLFEAKTQAYSAPPLWLRWGKFVLRFPFVVRWCENYVNRVTLKALHVVKGVDSSHSFGMSKGMDVACNCIMMYYFNLGRVSPCGVVNL